MNTPLETISPIVRLASTEDLAVIHSLLTADDLPTSDLIGGLPGIFFIAEVAGTPVGVAGLETLGDCGLMRSLVVKASWRSHGLGERLLAECETHAGHASLKHVYLLTTTAADYFRRRGYADIERQLVPAAVAGHAQFRNLCPSSAKCLGKSLTRSDQTIQGDSICCHCRARRHQ